VLVSNCDTKTSRLTYTPLLNTTLCNSTILSLKR
jgi:hypothetical protein